MGKARASWDNPRPGVSACVRTGCTGHIACTGPHGIHKSRSETVEQESKEMFTDAN